MSLFNKIHVSIYPFISISIYSFIYYITIPILVNGDTVMTKRSFFVCYSLLFLRNSTSTFIITQLSCVFPCFYIELIGFF